MWEDIIDGDDKSKEENHEEWCHVRFGWGKRSQAQRLKHKYSREREKLRGKLDMGIVVMCLRKKGRPCGIKKR